MKCPACGAELAQGQRDGLQVLACPKCDGAWFSAQAFDGLEDEAFDLGDDEKGSLAFESVESERKCPECEATLRRFNYRLYDLELEFCTQGHGYWLDAGEDKRVLQLMRQEEAGLKRSGKAETRWAALRTRLRAPSFLEKLGGLFR